MILLDRTAECAELAGRAASPLVKPVTFIVDHHCSLELQTPENPNPIADDDLEAAGLTRTFATPAMGTGGRIPYGFFVRRAGIVDQLLALDRQAAHACAFNDHSLAVCTAGEHGVSTQQYWPLVHLCVMLVLWTHGAEIVGHTSLEGASRDPKKRCPHHSFSIDNLRLDVRNRMPSGWRLLSRAEVETALLREGFVLSAPRAGA